MHTRHKLFATLCLLVLAFGAVGDGQTRLNRRFTRKKATPPVVQDSFAPTWTVSSPGPILMGFVAAQGQIPAGQGVKVGNYVTQTDVLNTWADGSLRHATAAFNATSNGAYGVTLLTNPGGSYTPSWPSASAVFVVTSGPGSGSTYTATLPAFTGTNTTANGAVARRAWTLVTPVTGGSTPHALLQVFFEITSYASGGHDVDFTVQNTKNVAAMAAVTYDVTLNVAGSAVFTKSAHKHWTGTIWHKNFYTGATEAVVQHDFTPWKQAHVIPTIVAANAHTYDFTGPEYQLGAPGSAQFGEMERHQGDAGTTERPDIQHINGWDAVLFANNTENARLASLKNGDMGGEWTWGITDTDGIGIPKVTDAAWTSVTSDFNSYPPTTPGIPSGFGLWKIDTSGYYWEGSRIGGNADVTTDVNNEHLPEPEFIPYLLTGKFFYLQALRQHASWAVLIGFPSWSEAEPRFLPGLMRGRNGTQGIVSNTSVTREFSSPLKNVLHAAWAMPDASADKSYFITIAQNNLNYLGYYVNYWITNNLGGALEGFCCAENGVAAQYGRSNSVVSTTSGNPTTLTVIGDDSAIGIANNANDHGAQTGDYVALTGFVTSGATALNGAHVGPITRLSATSFSVPINTTATTTSEGTYTFVVGFTMSAWRLWFTAYQADWALRTGLFTVDATVLDFVNRSGRIAIKMSAGLTDTDYFTNHKSGMAYGWYPSYGYVTGDTLHWYATLDELRADHANLTSTTARLFLSQAVYSANGSATHRGNLTGWNENEPELQGHNQQADAMLVIAEKRALAGATTELARRRAVTGHTGDMSAHPGMYVRFDY